MASLRLGRRYVEMEMTQRQTLIIHLQSFQTS